MKYKMRLAQKAMSEAACRKLLAETEYGVLALCGGDLEPYAVPVNYVYDGQSLYFHGAMEGKKIDLIRQNPRASFSVVCHTEIMRESFNTRFQSVCLFGTVELLQSDEEKLRVFRLLSDRFVSAPEETIRSYFSANLSQTAVFRLNIEEMTGKQKL